MSGHLIQKSFFKIDFKIRHLIALCIKNNIKNNLTKVVFMKTKLFKTKN